MSESRLRQLLADQHSGSPGDRNVRVLGTRGAVSAADIARLTGLARSTVLTALVELRRSGLVVDGASEHVRDRGVGRSATKLTLHPTAGTCVGIHLGLAEIRIVLADVSHSVIAEQTIGLGPDYRPDRAIRVLRDAVAHLYRDNGLSASGMIGTGISVSAPVSPDGTVQRSSILPVWTSVNARAQFEPILKRPVYVDNESNCAPVAEMMWGAAAGFDDFVLFRIDLGVGGAIVSRGRIVTGIAIGAGEFGHITIDPNGDLCRCGNRGCLELYASFGRPLEQLSRLHGRDVSTDDAILLAEQGDAGALRLIGDTAEMAGRGLALIGTIINPPLILVGGRMGLAGEILLAPLQRAFEKHTLIKSNGVPPSARTQIKIGKLTENDSLLGAVGLVLRSQGDSRDPGWHHD